MLACFAYAYLDTVGIKKELDVRSSCIILQPICQEAATKKMEVTSLFVSRWSPTLVLEKALSCLTSLIGREAVEPGWYERY